MNASLKKSRSAHGAAIGDRFAHIATSTSGAHLMGRAANGIRFRFLHCTAGVLAMLGGAMCLFLAAALPVRAASADPALDEGVSAYVDGDFSHALEVLTPLATAGNGRAQGILGQLYQGKTGVPRDTAKALQWARKSAAQNDPDGEMALSNLYLAGDGVPKDEAQALALIHRAVAQNNAEAKLRLGLMYINGQGVARDPAIARLWMSASAKQHYFAAQVILGRVVLNEGTRLDAGLPIGGDASADAALPPLAASIKQAAQAGDAKAQLALGRSLYAQGLSTGADVTDALPWVEKAAASGDAMAQFAAGALYIDGTHGIPYNDAKARAWFEKGLAQLP
jgi:TPR repeat protein